MVRAHVSASTCCSALCSALLSCSLGTVEVLPLPSRSPTIILAFEEGEKLEMFAYDWPDGAGIRSTRSLEPDDRVALTALLFDDRLEDLGVTPGLIAPSPVPHRRIVADEAFVATYTLGELSGWTPGLPSVAVREFPFPDRSLDLCRPFEWRILTEQPRSGGSIALGLGDGSALVAYGRHFIHFAPDGAIVEEADNEGLAGASSGAGIFVAGRDLHRVDVRPLRFDFLAPIPDEIGSVIWMSAGDAGELFTFTGKGEFGRYDGGAWSLLATLPITGNDISKGGVLWLGPGTGAALNPASSSIARWEGGIVTDPTPEEMGFGAAAITRRFGPIAVGTRLGGVLTYAGLGNWVPVLMRVPARVQVIAEFGDGVAYGTQAGTFGLAFEAITCPETPVGDFSEVFEIAPLGDGLIAGGITVGSTWRWISLEPK